MAKYEIREKTKQKLSYKILKTTERRCSSFIWLVTRYDYIHILKTTLYRKETIPHETLLAWSYTKATSVSSRRLEIRATFFKFEPDVIKRFLALLSEYHWNLEKHKLRAVGSKLPQIILNLAI